MFILDANLLILFLFLFFCSLQESKSKGIVIEIHVMELLIHRMSSKVGESHCLITSIL